MTIRPVLFFIFEQKVGHGHNSKVSDAVRHLFTVCTEAALGIQGTMHELSVHKIIGKCADVLHLGAALLYLTGDSKISFSRSTWTRYLRAQSSLFSWMPSFPAASPGT